MANMNINGKFEMRLSLDSINEYKEFLKNYKDKLPEAVENIVRRVSEVGLENNYVSTTLLPVIREGNVVSGGIQTTNSKETYAEFGTGMVGKNSPHIPEWLAKAGWEYYVPSDYKATVNGVQGWFTSYDEFGEGKGFVVGIPAQKKFYEASERMEEAFRSIAREEFKKISG